MNANQVDTFIMANRDYFPQEALPAIRQRLLQVSEDYMSRISMLQFKNPTTAIVLSIIVGSLGVDRFYIGDTGLGIGKLLTCGGGGIWTIVDWFLIMNATRQKNLTLLSQVI